ncbi:hypothetical protein HYT05_00635, partial [Candidatus Kaiserbacteria bacterium]|nr:hypothetical protein [Candidatus Kaiserbacteria bacterium]
MKRQEYHIHGAFVSDGHKGENGPQGPAQLFQTVSSLPADPLGIDQFEEVSGKTPSYNNLCDLDRAICTMTHIVAGLEKNKVDVFEREHIVVALKHGNCCGAAFHKDPTEAIRGALAGDLIAVFGGVVILNFPVTRDVAENLLYFRQEKGKRFLAMVVAPSFKREARESFGNSCVLLENAELLRLNAGHLDTTNLVRPVRGGFLVQKNYTHVPDFAHDEMARYGALLPNVVVDMLLGWAVGSTSNSNTITLVRDRRLIANAVGQQDRVGAARLAVDRGMRS